MSRLISPLARVTFVGTGDEFVSGDGILKAVSVELGEEVRSSRCSVSLFDRNLAIGAKYQAISFAQGGIITPEGLLKEVSPNVAPAVDKSDPSGTTTSGSSAQNASLKPEVRAFLDLIAYAEGSGYNVMFPGRRFRSYADHPRTRITSGDLTSDAAGRYQFLASTWDDAKKALGLKDFSPASQDLAAVWLIDKKRNALKYVEQGSKGLKQALDILSYEWASFPPARYPQETRSLQDLTNKYISFLLKYQGQTPAQQAAAIQPQIVDKAATKPIEKKDKGCEIIVELGYSLDQMVAFYFWHVATTTSRNQLDTTVFEGQSIRWTMTRRIQNTAYTNITLRQLAQMLCDRYRLRLDMEGNGPTYQYLDQAGISDYQLLLREARAIGYSIREKGNKLIIKPYRPNFTGFVITRDILQEIKFGDRASADSSPSPGTTTSSPAVPAADNKLMKDRKTGQPVQTRVEDSTATGVKTGARTAITGAPTPAVRGTTIPDTSVTGLPKQEIGSIDLADGKAEGAVIQDESRRVKGYESSCTLVTTPEALTIAPGSIIGVSDEVAPSPFNREWRVASVRHTLSTGGMRSEVSMYSPQAAKANNGIGSTSTSTPSSSATPTEIKPGRFVLPCTGKTGNGINGGGNGLRRHTGVDIANVQGTPIVASAEGVVYKALTGCRVGDHSCGGGYGNNVVIQHPNGYFTRYAHLHEVLVSPGQKVKQGERIGTMGNTGRSFGSHLHFEIRKGGSFTDQAVVFSSVGLIIPQPHDAGFKY
jgi:muramidase (phage lysozyme)/biotin carboxyl carrier protein